MASKNDWNTSCGRKLVLGPVHIHSHGRISVYSIYPVVMNDEMPGSCNVSLCHIWAHSRNETFVKMSARHTESAKMMDLWLKQTKIMQVFSHGARG